MQLSDLKPGMVVEITYKGIVQADEYCRSGEFGVRAGEPGPEHQYHYHRFDAVRVELAEPDYENGAVYQSANGRVYRFSGADSIHGLGWVNPNDGSRWAFATPMRPMVKLVPEAKDA